MAQAAEHAVCRDYLSECLRMLTESNANGGRGPYVTAKLCDIIQPKLEDERTGEEIKRDILKKLREEARREST